MEWLTQILLPLAALLLGGGGIAALYKAYKDSKLGIRTTDIAEGTAQSEFWKNIIETQTKVLLDPLTSQVATLSGKVVELEVEVKDLRKEREDWHRQRYLYWMFSNDLIEHILSGKGPPAPKPPEDLDFRR